MVGTHWLPILPVRHEDIVQRLRERHALRVPATVRRLGDDPVRTVLEPGLLEQHRQRHASPLATTHAAVRPRHGRGPGIRPVADAFEKADPRHERKPPQLVHREHQRPIHHPLDHQGVLVRVDVGDAVVVLRREMERCRRDHPDQLGQRGAGARPLRNWPCPRARAVTPPLDLACRGDEARTPAVEHALEGVVVDDRRRGRCGARRPGGQRESRGGRDQACHRRALLQEPSPAGLRVAHLPSSQRLTLGCTERGPRRCPTGDARNLQRVDRQTTAAAHHEGMVTSMNSHRGTVKLTFNLITGRASACFHHGLLGRGSAHGCSLPYRSLKRVRCRFWRMEREYGTRSARRLTVRVVSVRPTSFGHSASGCGRIWNRTISLVIPFPPSLCQLAIVSLLAHRPRPFHPASGSSIRPSRPRV